MTGYTPVFDTVFQGTLCGRWPTLPVWLSLLPLADKHGHIDMTYQAISVLSGWPVDLLKEGIAELMKPDPESRSRTADGRRLELIDPENRSWGWRLVNHGKYRERARLMSKDSARRESGRDAERKRAARLKTQCPPVSPGVPPSDSDSDAYSNKDQDGASASFDPSLISGLDQQAWREWVEYRIQRKPAIKTISMRAAAEEMARLGPAQAAAVRHTKANGWQGLREPDAPKMNGSGSPKPRDDAAWREARSHAEAIGFRQPGEHESVGAYTRAMKTSESTRNATPAGAAAPRIAALAAKLRGKAS